MKNLLMPGFCLSLFMLLSGTLSAQNKIPVNEPDMNKPQQFKNLPAKIPVHPLDLQSLVNSPAGRDVSLVLEKSASLSFTGKVVSSTSKYNNNIRSVVIRSGNFNGATFTLSSSIRPDGTVRFTGRIINREYGDVYELQNQNGQYILIKKSYHDLIAE